jgi:hypothetical protein
MTMTTRTDNSGQAVHAGERPTPRRDAGLLLLVGLMLLPALAGAAQPVAKNAHVIAGKSSAPARESPYVRVNREHAAASAAELHDGPRALQRPPRLAGQVQRR